MAVIFGIIGGLLAFGVIVGIGYSLHLIGIGVNFGIWFYIPCALVAILAMSVTYSAISGYFTRNEAQIDNDVSAFMRRHIFIRAILFIVILVIIGYFSYKIWIYTKTVYPFKLAILISIVNIIFNLFFLKHFFKIYRSVFNCAIEVGKEKVSAYGALVFGIFFAFCYFDYRYLLAPAFDLDKKASSVANFIGNKIAESQISQAIIGSQIPQKEEPKKLTKKSKKKKKKVASSAT